MPMLDTLCSVLYIVSVSLFSALHRTVYNLHCMFYAGAVAEYPQAEGKFFFEAESTTASWLKGSHSDLSYPSDVFVGACL